MVIDQLSGPGSSTVVLPLSSKQLFLVQTLQRLMELAGNEQGSKKRAQSSPQSGESSAAAAAAAACV